MIESDVCNHNVDGMRASLSMIRSSFLAYQSVLVEGEGPLQLSLPPTPSLERRPIRSCSPHYTAVFRAKGGGPVENKHQNAEHPTGGQIRSYCVSWLLTLLSISLTSMSVCFFYACLFLLH